MLPTRDSVQPSGHTWGQSERRERYFMQVENKKELGQLALLISDKIDFKLKMVTRDKKGHYIMVSGQFIKRL